MLVVQGDVRGVAAAREVGRLIEADGDRLGVVVRRGRTRLLSPATVADGLGCGCSARSPTIPHSPWRRSGANRRPGRRGRRWRWRAARFSTGCAARRTSLGMIDFDSRPAGAGGPELGEFESGGLESIRDRLSTLGRPHSPADVAAAMRADGLVVTDASVIETVESLRRNSIGAGRAGRAAAGPGRHRHLGQRTGSGVRRPRRRTGADRPAVRLGCGGAPAGSAAGRVGGSPVDDSSPFVDARLADGCRVHAVLGAVAAPGTCISLRVPAEAHVLPR